MTQKYSTNALKSLASSAELVLVDPATAAATAPAFTPLGGLLTEVLTDVLGVDQVPAGSYFFDDLAADSTLTARFCARARTRLDLPTTSMKDVNFVRAASPAPRARNDHSDFWFKGSA
jgi:hypothetical protein